MTKREHALDAAARGLRVFPQRGKIPGIKRWPYNANAQPSVIERWWKRWPDADIGIALDSGLYVLDADTPQAMSAVRGLKLPRTLVVETARGAHYYLRTPHQLARMVPRPEAFGLGAIEGKGAPGPVTWAGSVHPSGKTYAVVVDAPIASMPLALVREIGPKRSQANVGEATDAERAAWGRQADAIIEAGCRFDYGIERVVRDDARADLNLALRALRSDLPHMQTGWADRFFRAGAYLGSHIASGGLRLDSAIEELTAVFTELDTDEGPDEHVLRSIARGVATGARQAGL